MELNKVNLTELNPTELTKINGGEDVPSEDTGFWYDVAFAVNAALYTPRPGWILL